MFKYIFSKNHISQKNENRCLHVNELQCCTKMLLFLLFFKIAYTNSCVAATIK